MIGTVVQAAGDPPQGEISSKLVDLMYAKMGRPAKPLDPADLWFSASDAHNLCQRLFALAVRHGISIREAPDPELMWIFAVGTGYHYALQNDLLPSLGTLLQGGWQRISKDGTVLEVHPGKTAGPWTEPGRGWSPKPEGDYWKFVEPKGRIQSCRFVGKWDGVLVWPDGATEVLEIKSIREDQFPSVNPLAGGRPKADHVLQVQSYLWMSGLERGRLLYVAKGSDKMRHMLAEHVVVRDDAAIRKLEADLTACGASVEAMVKALEAAKDMRRGLEEIGVADRESIAQSILEKATPERPAVCRIKSDPRARKCDLRDICFPPKPKKEKPAKAEKGAEQPA
ncbi:MAG: hypothetical protein WC406_08415 [Methanoregula sp.]|jgi:hypothetical protein